jgi:VWFA-related protein
MRRALCCVTLGIALGAGPLAGWTAGEPVPPPPAAGATFEGEIDVSLLQMVVRVVDTWGNPILGLQPEDFRVRVGKLEVPVVGLDWISPAEPRSEEGEAAATGPPVLPTMPTDRAAEPTSDRAPAPPAGRLVVVFVQADLQPVRISGQMRLRPHTRELLATLHPGDRVAVVSFDSHLKLWQDFAEDLEATLDAIDVAMLWSVERPVAPAEPHSLARHFDRAAARAAASPERALELVGRALAALPGEKTMLFLGWGIGRFGSSGLRMTPAYGPAVRALRAARTSVFVLDVTSADAHSLAGGLEGVAAATGGAYFSTYRLPALATRTVARAISGYYLLTLDHASFAEEEGRVRVELRGKRGTVLARPVGLYAPPS